MNRIKIYATQLNTSDTLDKYDFILSCLTYEKRKRVLSLKQRQDQLRSLKGEWLARSLLSTILSLPLKKLIFELNNYGKPYIKEPGGIYFNISHSGDWIVCAIASEKIGIDIERIESIDFSILSTCLSKNEMEYLYSKPAENQLLLFYDLWTLKESFYKCIGEGFFIPLNSISIDSDTYNLAFEGPFNYPVSFKQYDIDPHYKLSVCSFNNYFEENITIVKF